MFIQSCSKWPHRATECWKCSESYLRCAVSVKTTPDFKDIMQIKRNAKYVITHFFLIWSASRINASYIMDMLA